jgi:hypothetical protein
MFEMLFLAFHADGLTGLLNSKENDYKTSPRM